MPSSGLENACRSALRAAAPQWCGKRSARSVWGLGGETHPSTASCLGGKYFFDDDQQFPDTQYAVFEYPVPGKSVKKQLIFEQRIWSPYVQEGYENGAAFYGTKGMLIVGHSV